MGGKNGEPSRIQRRGASITVPSITQSKGRGAIGDLGEKFAVNPVTIDNLAEVQVLDLMGKGTACLAWSSPLEKDAAGPRYIDLMGGEEPHLLVKTNNQSTPVQMSRAARADGRDQHAR
jgi:hypothetical protein